MSKTATHPKAGLETVEWQTLVLILVTTLAWGWSTWVLAAEWSLPAVLATGVLITLHSSLQHEVIHGHPTGRRWLDEALVAPAFSLLVPFRRFRDLHLAHHRDAALTDPFDDPESNFMDGPGLDRLPAVVRELLYFNNTLLGRVLIGPFVGLIWFVHADIRAIRRGEREVLAGWLWHIPAVVPVLLWVWASPLSLWQYLLAVWIGSGILKVRTYAEHRAHELARGRTVIIEDRGPLAFLFLNNNLHAVHHAEPGLPWYRLPQRFAAEPGLSLRLLCRAFPASLSQAQGPGCASVLAPPVNS